MEAPKIFTVCGSLRAGSFNAILLASAEAEVIRLGGTVERYADLKTLPHYDHDVEVDLPDSIAVLRAAITASDGLLIASPSYNGNTTGALKDFIDWVSRPFGQACIAGKPIGIIAASVGPGAGLDAALYLERICNALTAKVVHPISMIGKVTTVLTDANLPDQLTTAMLAETAQALVLTARGASVVRNDDRSRFELCLNETVVGFADFRTMQIGTDTVVELPHTETDPQFGGQGMASFLTRAALDMIAADTMKVIPSCSFVARFIEKHPTYGELVFQG